ncbi:acetyl/propionyl/methylcrotonyl-CoA carboxylase subunit alpha [uncultured Thiothrix sp.]|uniref:acetyl/propionyl/methylcrotonyl-CoA carboxylase subunit alpha n=1 Tax=uncultured Thiothrix sp. TaxID=223185 RepID=UPI00261D9E6B|nr:acetyl/propionyl/methylcrotonyl-CoA carboxylase subunit alpha [uncultured Thiothrix sp.]HMT93682.1 acetyl/propionyl/methylcrotonyl-CoA carboxylase subunit alpha [Thiolinea sp.]
MFTKILIANRGEIACRVARTARRLGIKTVAVYSTADAKAEHVKACDEAYWIGEAPAAESYLHGDKILAIAKLSGAQAIHPGYGFLSENAGFAESCKAAGVVFIGPPTQAIIAMGLKSESKRLMTEAKVPLVPGYHGADQAIDLLREQSQTIGYPQLIKASAGGGGKGMRVVKSFDEFDAALASAKREAISSFGNDAVLIERYLQKPRHVELQVFADTLGNVVHVFERDCSVQRRHQKVIEEAPAPQMTPELRHAMGQAAINAAKAIGYVGAGTVEFLLDQSGEFFFMEMNTRLQVEHPVTEMISGQDLVEWQLRVANGEPLPLTQEQLKINGHAFEARVYAETPERDFLPSTGRVSTLIAPETNDFVRIDTGIRQGDEVSMFYDPMIAKLIVWGQDRTQALQRLQEALSKYYIGGLNTNLEFLGNLARSADFAAGDVHTGFIEQHMAELFPEPSTPPDEVFAAALWCELDHTQARASKAQRQTLDPCSPWAIADAWRMNQASIDPFEFQVGEALYSIQGMQRNGTYYLKLATGEKPLSGERIQGDEWQIVLGQKTLRIKIIQSGNTWLVFWNNKVWHLNLHDPVHEADDQGVHGGGLTAPMAGTVLDVMVKVGDQVKAGDALMVMVAMKMEHTIAAPKEGIVQEIYFQVGDQVKDGDTLLSLE